MSSSGDRKAAVKKLKNLFFTPKTEVKEYRERMDSTFSSPVLPNGVEYSEKDFSGVKCDVLVPEVYNSRRVVLYVHGGSFVGGSRKAYRPFVASLATAVSGRAVIPEFRLAPTHAYPASVEDLETVFRTLYTDELVANSLDNRNDLDKARPEIILAADGSGASMALALVFGLSGRFRHAIRQIVLFSPWLDVSVDSKKFTVKKAGDDLVTAEILRRSSELYTFQNNRNIPEVSPVLATKEQLLDFPPVYIQTGSDDFMLEDAEKLEVLLKENENQCTLDVWPHMMPMFQLADEELEEAHLAIEKIGKMFTYRKVTKDDSQTEVLLVLERKTEGEE